MTPVMDLPGLEAYLRQVFPQADDYGWRTVALRPGEMEMAMAVSDRNLRPGGTVSGPTMFALADVTAYALVLAHVGEVALAVTTSLNINFLSKPAPGDLTARGRLIKLGRRLAICEIHMFSAQDPHTMVAQATATYSIPPRGKEKPA